MRSSYPELLKYKHPRFTPDEDALLIALYSSTPVKDIAARIKRTVWAVYNRTGVLRSSYPELLKYKHPRFTPDED
ncbi:hypothetical protein PSZ81_24285, partial [Shigella sonnei]|nr:hypothetical protein [Shigella sonnei]